MSDLYYLLYLSNATHPMEPGELKVLLDVCQKNNKGRDITGMLLYKGGCFMQILEGEKEQIRALFDKVCLDSRHENVVEIGFEPIRERSFSDWSMGFVDMDRVIPDSPDFGEYFQENFGLRSLCADTEAASLFIRSFNSMSPG